MDRLNPRIPFASELLATFLHELSWNEVTVGMANITYQNHPEISDAEYMVMLINALVKEKNLIQKRFVEYAQGHLPRDTLTGVSR